MQLVRMFVFFGLLLAAAACGPAQSGPQIDPTQGVALLAGIYTTSITAEDVAAFTKSNDPSLSDTIGTYIFQLAEDGQFEVTMNGAFLGQGNYTVTNNTIAIYLDQVCEDCDCRQSIDRYYWLFSEGELTLQHYAGTCTPLQLIAEAHPLVRQP